MAILHLLRQLEVKACSTRQRALCGYSDKIWALLPPSLPVRIGYAMVRKEQLIQICADQLHTDGLTMNDFQITFQGFAVKVYFSFPEDESSVKIFFI